MLNEKLLAARKAKHWSIEVASARIGVSRVTYSRWENGHQEPQPGVLALLCQAFGMPADELGYGHLSRTPDPVRAKTNILLLDQDDEKRTLSSAALPAPRIVLPAHGAFAAISEGLPVDSATWFSEKLIHLMLMVNQWHGCTELCKDIQKALDREFIMFDEIRPFYPAEEYHLSRRQALLTLAALPMGLLGAVQYTDKTTGLIEELLPLCSASVTACWHLMTGKDIISVERALARYFSLLTTWARQPSRYQRTAAYFAAQSCMLMGLIELHHMRMRQWLAYCTQAVEHATVAHDRTLHVYTLIFLGAALKDNDQPQAMLQTHQEAARYLKEIEPVVQSKVLAELARSYARNGHVQEALRWIEQARDIFPGEIGDIPCFVSADCGLFQLILLEGLTHLDLGQRNASEQHHRQAWEALAQVEYIPAETIPDRLRYEILNQRTLTAVRVGNLEQFRGFLIEGVNGARVLGSEKRRQELVTIYKEGRMKWPHESQVLELADLLV